MGPIPLAVLRRLPRDSKLRGFVRDTQNDFSIGLAPVDLYKKRETNSAPWDIYDIKSLKRARFENPC